jgi:hypothetical protein
MHDDAPQAVYVNEGELVARRVLRRCERLLSSDQILLFDAVTDQTLSSRTFHLWRLHALVTASFKTAYNLRIKRPSAHATGSFQNTASYAYPKYTHVYAIPARRT